VEQQRTEVHRIEALIGGQLRPVALHVTQSLETDRASIDAELDDGSRVAAEGVEVWHALLNLRQNLEARGIRLGIVGALPEVWPSGMSAQMSGGRKAYRRVVDGSPVIVDVLESIDPRQVVTVAEQRSMLDAWMASRDIRRR
jgi:hypothetical protein